MDEEDVRYCDCCGEIIPEDDESYLIGDDIICEDCRRRECGCCENCDELIYNNEAITDDGHFVCRSCYENEYYHCNCCGMLLHQDDIYTYNDMDFCYDCYSRKNHTIHEYSYKPENLLFYGDGERYLGVELEVDEGGHDDDNALEILEEGNYTDEHIYIKNDGSLHNGFEIVTHPMTLSYHLNDFCWEDVLHKAVQLGYLSHQTATCGLHVHVNRTALGNNEISQDMAISRILYFVEQNWNELLKFSRRTESAMNRWAARFGYESTPKKLLNKAKCTYGRYHAVNLCNRHTIEFRMFRGTLKLETLYATLQLVDRICDLAVNLTDSEMQNISWSEFVSYIDEKELINYLKRRRLYVNEPVTVSEDL